MTCAERQEQSLALVALPDDDPERIAAEEHARGCAACAQALAEARSMLLLLGEHGAPVAPTAAALRRAAAPVVAELRGPPRQRAWPALGALIGGALVVLLARHRHTDAYSLAGAAVVLVVALVAAAGMGVRGWARVAVAVAVSALFALVVGEAGSLDPVVGVKCVLLEMMAAAPPLATTAWLAWRRRAPLDAAAFVAAAAAGALAGQAGLHLTCPHRLATPHLLAFHLGGVVLAAAVGLLVSRIRRLGPAGA